MKKSVEILGLPVISITEGRELGMSKTLLMDAKKGIVAAITIEDEDWYRGVKLIPYESVIAIGDDAVTVTNSETILKLDDAGDFENLLDENIRIIGTKAITKTGTIQGKISEVFVGDNGKIEKCEITAPDGTTSEVTADQISIFGKQVTVIDPDGEKKTESVVAELPKAAPAPSPVPEPPKSETPKVEEPKAEEPKPADIPAASPAPAKTEEPAKAEEPEKAEEPAKQEPQKAEPPKAAEAPKAEPPKADEKKAAPPKAEPPKAAAPAPSSAEAQKQQAADKATEERHRRFLLGKKAARTIKMDNGIVIVEAGADITEEVLQKAKLANKFIELSMNVQ